MYCKYCGRKTEDGSDICSECMNILNNPSVNLDAKPKNTLLKVLTIAFAGLLLFTVICLVIGFSV